MKKFQVLMIALLFVAFAVTAMAQSQSPIHLFNRLRLGYDDNVYQVDDPSSDGQDPTESMRIIEEIEVLVNWNLERAYLGLRYRPSFIWYSDREDDDTDILHDLSVNASYNFSPNLVFSLSDTLRASQMPELQDENYIVREDDDNYYNSAVATLAYNLKPETRIDLSGRFITLTYTDDSPAKDNDNYWSAVGGVSLFQQLAGHTTLSGDLRYQTLCYNDAPESVNRDANTIFAGLGIEQTFSPQLIGNLRGGVQNRQYDDDYYDDNTKPYVDASITFMPTPATRMTLSGGYAISESDVAAYLSQDRFNAGLSLAHDFTAKLSFFASGSLAMGQYDADYVLVDDKLAGYGDADENTYLFSARLSYRLNRINWVELGYQFTCLDSEVLGRESYQRNRADIGWKIQLF